MTVRIIQSPILPAPISDIAGLPFWSRQLTESIARSFDTIASRIEDMNVTESMAASRPEAAANRGFYYDETNKKIYFDDGEWNLVGTTDAEDITLDTTDFDNNLSSADSDIQTALETIDDLSFDDIDGTDTATVDIITTADVGAATGDFPVLVTSHSKTLTDGSATTFAWTVAATAPWGGAATFHYEVEAEDGTDVNYEGGFVTLGLYRTSGGATAATPAKHGTVSGGSTGSLTVAFAADASSGTHAAVRCTATSSGMSSPTITMRMIAIGNGGQDVTWI